MPGPEAAYPGPDALPAEDPGSVLGLGLHWEATPPPGVVAPCHDPAWELAVAALAGDPEYLLRRALVEEIALHVVVRDADEATLTAHPEDGATTSVALVLPAAGLTDGTGGPLTAEDRAQELLDAVATLVVETAAALGRTDEA